MCVVPFARDQPIGHVSHMASRDRFTINIKCPECGHSGMADASENDYPFMRSPGFQYDSLPEGFGLAKLADFRENTFLRCRCSAEFAA